MKYDIWQEGFYYTGMEGVPAKAELLANGVESDDFIGAVKKWWDSEPRPYNAFGDLSIRNNRAFIWGIELFDNEEDARKALTPLISGNVQHALNAGPAKALTGPVERGDITTLEKHMQVTDSEEDKELYRLLSKKLLPLAKAKNPDRDYSSLEDFLETI
jgi:hypothetical protein